MRQLQRQVPKLTRRQITLHEYIVSRKLSVSLYNMTTSSFNNTGQSLGRGQAGLNGLNAASALLPSPINGQFT